MIAPEIKTPAQYCASLAEPHRSDVRALRDAIRKDIPEHKPGMIGGFLGFGKYHYKYASGREGNTSVVAISSQKQYSSLYLGCTGAGYLAEKANTASAKSPSANAASDSRSSRNSISRSRWNS